MGRASCVVIFDLLGRDIKDYEDKFEWLKKINEEVMLNWTGKFRVPLKKGCHLIQA